MTAAVAVDGEERFAEGRIELEDKAGGGAVDRRAGGASGAGDIDVAGGIESDPGDLGPGRTTDKRGVDDGAGRIQFGQEAGAGLPMESNAPP
jgi:hypothetical protein